MSELVYFKAPELCQGSDEDILIEMGAIIFEGFIDRMPGENGLRLCVSGDYRDLKSIDDATNKFQILLGALRAWKPTAGQRSDEVRSGIGSGSIRDENGNQVIHVGIAQFYIIAGGEVESYAKQVRDAIGNSQELKNAIWLNGRRERKSADCYMVYEYAEQAFKGKNNLAKELKISNSDISKLCQSINNLCPTKGGRHAKRNTSPKMDLKGQFEFTALLLKKWIAYEAQQQKYI